MRFARPTRPATIGKRAGYALDEGEQRAVAGGGRHDNAATAANAGCAKRFLRRGEIGWRSQTRAAAFG